MAKGGKDGVRNAAANATRLRVVETDADTPRARTLPLRCPVTPLGVFGTTRYYLDAKQQLVAMEADKHARLNLLGLFHQHSAFIYTVPDWLRTNDKGIATGIRYEVIAEDLLAACGEAGIWDAAKRERGRGAWRGEAGELILHCGDQVLTFDAAPGAWASRQQQKPGLIGGYVYPAGEATAKPSETDPSDDSPGEALLQLLQTWRWKRGDLDAVLVLGWLGAAMIGGALAWRPAIWLTGGRGTGKSTLQELIKLLFGEGILSLANTTGAGVWQTLGQQTLPVMVDELEPGEDNRKVQAVIDLARISASGGKMARGSDRHKSVMFELRACFAFGSILVPPLTSADRSRLAVLELSEQPPDSTPPQLVRRDIAALGARLRRRLVEEWPRFDQALASYQRALREAGHSARGADQFGTLLACADLLLFRDQTDHYSAQDWVAQMGAAEMSETADDTRDEVQCLHHLLGCPIDPFRNGERVNLGEWVNRAANRVHGWDDVRQAQRVLEGYGVRVDWHRERQKYTVAIANTHTGLCRLFDRTRWHTPEGMTGVWAQALRRLPGAERSTQALYFGGPNSRATIVPIEQIPAPDPATQRAFDGLTDPALRH